MKLVFLGTGGGRVVMSLQLRGTGGFLVKTRGKQIHVDPGPGAITRIRKSGEDPRKTDIICLSHNHTDHVDDARVMSECAKDPVLVSSKACIEAPDGILGPYNKKKFSRIFVAESGKTIEIDKLKMHVKKALHERTVGFVFEGKYKIGYTSDTNYFEGLSKEYDGVDAMIFNVLRPGSDRWKGHLCSEDVIKIIDDMEKKPRIVYLSHFGYKMLKANPIQEARNISKKTGVLCVAAKDGKKIDLRSELSQTRLF